MNQRPLLLTSCYLLWCAAVANPQAASQSSSGHFRWSERLAHELSYQHTIATAKELMPEERASLLGFILNRFQHPASRHDADMFEDMSNKELRKLALDTRIEFYDLNGDGKNEIIAQGNGLGACGGTGNCVVLVLQSTPTGFQILLDSRAGKFGRGFEKIRIMESRTNGYRDIVLASHVSASDRTLEVFRFKSGEYRRSGCFYSTVWSADHPEGLKNPDISHGCPGQN